MGIHSGNPVFVGQREGKGFQQMTSLATATAPTLPASGGVRQMFLQAESQNVRFRDDGVDPTAAVGMIVYAGDPPLPFYGDFSKVKFIEVAASAKLNITYYA